ncbi:MAG: ABC transporter permease [Alloprevotella sp.]
MQQFLSFVHKEFLQIFRDSRTVLILLVMPIVLIVLFGYAVTTEVRGTAVVIVDEGGDACVPRWQEAFNANRYFSVVKITRTAGEAEELFRSGKADMAIVVENGFSDRLRRSGGGVVQLLADGSEPNQASVRTAYAASLLKDLLASSGAAPAQTVSATAPTRYAVIPCVRLLYNPAQKSEYNFVPGVMGLILMLICAMMTSISIVREKELGTMEVLLASPLPPLAIVCAKLMPYLVISIVNLLTILALSTFLLGVPMAGSLTVFLGISLLYIFVCLLLGLLVSTFVATQLAAMLISLLLIVPSLYFSGLAFPLESMPTVLQYFSGIVPARWFVEAARKLMIQGVAPSFVVRETLILALMAAVLLVLSLVKFKRRLE